MTNIAESLSNGHNVLVLGQAGTGKTTACLNALAQLPGKNISYCASSGIAACNISGQTLHSFGGILQGRYGLLTGSGLELALTKDVKRLQEIRYKVCQLRVICFKQ